MADKTTILLVEFRFNGGFEPRYVATQTWYSLSKDSIGIREYDGRIVESPTYSTAIGCIIWGNSPATGFGAIELTNADFGISDWLSLDARDSECFIHLIELGQGYDEGTQVARCIVDGIEQAGQNLRINLRGRDTLLDKPLQVDLYDGAPNATLTETPKPIALGTCHQVEPTAFDPTNLEFHVNDVRIEEIVNVYSGGSVVNSPLDSPDQWQFNDDRTGFIMSIDPQNHRILTTLVGGLQVSNDILGTDGQFNDPSQWSGGNPTGWTTIEFLGSVIDEAPGVGARFLGNSTGAVNINHFGLVNDTWYAIVGKVARVNGGRIMVLLEGDDTNPIYLDTEGEFAFVRRNRVGSLLLVGNVVVDGGGREPCDVTLSYLHVYRLIDPVLTLGDYLTHLTVARGGFIFEELSLADYLSDPSNPNPQVGFYSKQAITIRDAVNLGMSSITGWAWVGPDGQFRMGRLAPPNNATTPIVRISRLNLIEFPTFVPDDAPGLSNTWAGQKNWYPYSQQELAGITFTDQQPFIAEYRTRKQGNVALNRAYRHAIGAKAIETLMVDEPELSEEADRITGVYSRQNGFWDVRVAFADEFAAAALQIGDVVQLDDDEIFGPEYSGTNASVVAINGQFRNNEVQFRTWAGPYEFLVTENGDHLVTENGEAIVLA